jgi:glucose/arabinose dehydrogenase
LRAVVALAATALLAGCASAGGGVDGNWSGAPERTSEPNPLQVSPGGGAEPGLPGQGANSNAPSPSASGQPGQDPAVVAKHLSAPVGLVVLPDGTALVGERTTGRILRVQPVPDQPTPTVKRLTGLDTSGDGGLLDLALSPSYDEDHLVYAYITTARDNRVVAFTLRGPVTPVFTGIPKGRTGNTGRIAFAPDGTLYIGTGDAGRPALAPDPDSLAGKVLRVSEIGRPAPGNPLPTSPVYSRGQHEVDGLCLYPRTNLPIEDESTASGPAEVNVLLPGSNYGWPDATPSTKGPARLLPATSVHVGGCAVQGSTLYIASLDGRDVLSATIGGSGRNLTVSAFRGQLNGKYGRLRTVVAAPDGALWLTTSNKDGQGKPIADDERVIRLQAGGSGNNPT